MTKISGSCLCGTVQYESNVAPVIAGNCHCKDCQKASGSGYAPTFFVPESAVSIQGEVKFYESKGDSGQTVARGFCPNCGSQLFGRPTAMPGLLAIRAGSLDNLEHYQPQVDIYTSRAASWDILSPKTQHFPEMPKE